MGNGPHAHIDADQVATRSVRLQGAARARRNALLSRGPGLLADKAICSPWPAPEGRLPV